MIETAALANETLEDGSADAIFMARQMLRDPYIALHAATELGADVAWPQQYARARN
jgi:2,4-dienoyl-CoA reductase-like NADH-dependent reductase (Old Yellow Enzyme family)